MQDIEILKKRLKVIFCNAFNVKIKIENELLDIEIATFEGAAITEIIIHKDIAEKMKESDFYNLCKKMFFKDYEKLVEELKNGVIEDN